MNPQLFAILYGLLQIERIIMQELDNLKAKFGEFQADFAKFNADVQVKLATLAANQVTVVDKQAIVDIAGAFGELDTTVKNLDAALATDPAKVDPPPAPVVDPPPAPVVDPVPQP